MKFKDKQAREDAKRFNQTLKKLRKETKDVEAMNLNIEGLFIRLPNRLEELKKKEKHYIIVLAPIWRELEREKP